MWFIIEMKFQTNAFASLQYRQRTVKNPATSTGNDAAVDEKKFIDVDAQINLISKWNEAYADTFQTNFVCQIPSKLTLPFSANCV